MGAKHLEQLPHLGRGGESVKRRVDGAGQRGIGFAERGGAGDDA